MVALSGQNEQSEQLAELLVAGMTKSYAVYTYRHLWKRNCVAKMHNVC